MKKIFLTVGTQKFQFDRLLKMLDDFMAYEGVEYQVFAQTGNCRYEPKHYQYKSFVSKEEFQEYVELCDLVITHSGVATIMAGLKKNKPVIVVPRLKKYKEHVDNHQIEIANSFSEKNFVLMYREGESFSELIREAETHFFDSYESQNEKMIETLREYLSSGQNEVNEKENRQILMCGSELNVKGGMVSVIRNYLEYENWDGFQIHYIPTHIESKKIEIVLYFLIAYLKIFLKVVRRKVDIAYLHTAERGSFYRKAFLVHMLKLFGVKTVMHHHAAEFEEFYASLSDKKKKYVRRTLEKNDLNVVLSKRLITMITDKAPSSNVKVLYNAVQTYSSKPYNDKARNILFLGRLGKRKGVYDLLEVIRKIDSFLPQDIVFNLCGDGEIEDVKRVISEYGIEHRIAHVGWIDGEQKKRILKETMLNVLPSYNEGLPMTILETMAYGIPNISTNIASIPEVIDHGKNGYLIEPGDKEKLAEYILLLCQEKEIRLSMSENAWELINREFAMDAHIVKLKEYLLEL